MILSNIIETWDSILYSSYNIFAIIKGRVSLIKYHRILKHNLLLKNKYSGKRCFVVMNGPSLNEHNLSALKEEIVFCSNYFYKSELASIIFPNYYCFTDGAMYNSTNVNNILDEIRNKCPGVNFILSLKGVDVINKAEDTFLVNAKHMPHKYSIKNDFSTICSNFQTVAFFTINAAIYMGFSEIYVLGLDYNPGGFVHFANLGVECDKADEHVKKEEVAGDHWAYAKSHYESYALDMFAKRKNCRIINLNPQSCIRAFEFGCYEDIIKPEL